MVKSVLEIFSARFREAREACYSSQEALAEVLGVHPLTIGRWERGERLPSHKDLDKISKVLARELAWFFSIEDEVKTPRPLTPSESLRLIREHLNSVESTLMGRIADLESELRSVREKTTPKARAFGDPNDGSLDALQEMASDMSRKAEKKDLAGGRE